MSFKYRFILSFVLLEVFFITLIVSINFVALSSSSNKLIKDSIDSKVIFYEELIKVPLSVYDLATLDNILEKAQQHNIVNSIIILDNQGTILSKNFNFDDMSEEELLKIKKDMTFKYEDEIYEIRYLDIDEDGIKLGSMHLVFDVSDSNRFIINNKRKTLFIIFIEIMLSTLLAYLIGSKLTKMISKLSDVALEIGENKAPKIPFTREKGEIGILSRSLKQMQEDLNYRTESLKNMTKTLEEQKSELEFANKIKDDFLANMSHELKTPLNSINVISSVMIKNKKGNLDEKDLKNIHIINSSGNDLLLLINDVLDLSKLEAGEISVINEDIDVCKMLNDIYDNFIFQTEQKGIELELICDKKLDYIHSDKLRIQQILKNLLSNALKFTTAGKVSIIAKFVDEFLEITVKDSGIGIPKEKLEHIFDRFKQVDSSTTRKYGGTGLGLSISKELSSLLGGSIKATSEDNIGSEFTFTVLRNEDNINRDFIIQNSKNKSDIEKIIVLNTDTISFLYISIELKKLYSYIQANDLNELENRYSKGTKVVIDCDNMTKDLISKIYKIVSSEDLVVVYEDESKKDFLNPSSLLIKKPFKITDLKI